MGGDPADEFLIGAIRRGGEAGDDAAPVRLGLVL